MVSPHLHLLNPLFSMELNWYKPVENLILHVAFKYIKNLLTF